MIGAQVIVKMLEKYHVEYIFGVPGDTSIKLYEAQYDNQSKIRHISWMQIQKKRGNT